MSTTMERPDDGHPPRASGIARDAELVTLPRCTRCSLRYLPTKSTSALRLTYCSFLCELGDLGFSMAGLEHMERAKKGDIDLAGEAQPPVEPEPAAAI
jgi:hypothetical protein